MFKEFSGFFFPVCRQCYCTVLLQRCIKRYRTTGKCPGTMDDEPREERELRLERRYEHIPVLTVFFI